MRQGKDTNPPEPDAATLATPNRLPYLVLGWTCVSLGLVGAFLPLMPTTVFLLIAAWAFSRSSPRWHRWLREHARFGEAVRAWEEHHAMPRRAKRIAFIALAASYALTAWVFGPFSWAAIIGGLCIFGVALYIAHIPVLQAQEKRSIRT
jgi:uncharacterized membrane protein YbaN (DUF454 family)